MFKEKGPPSGDEPGKSAEQKHESAPAPGDFSFPKRNAPSPKAGSAPLKGIEAVSSGAEAVIRETLHDIARDLKDRQLRAYYRNERLPTVDLIGVLRHAEKTDCLELIKQLLIKTAESPEWLGAVKRRLPYLLHAAEDISKAEMIGSLLKLPKTKEQEALIVGVLQASKTLENLRAVVDYVGKDRLLALKSDDANELMAKAFVTLAMRQIELPPRIQGIPGGKRREKSLMSSFVALEDALNQSLAVCKGFPEFSKTEVVERAVANSENAISELRQDFERAGSSRERRGLFNRLILEAKLEFHYGISITTQQSRRERADGAVTHSHARRWTEDNLRELRACLEAFPGDMITINPVAQEIKRVPTPKNRHGEIAVDDLAAWCPGSLRIEVYDGAVEKFNSARQHPQARLRHTVAHELFHGILQGDRKETLRSWYEAATGSLGVESANPQWDFDLFCARAGWKIVLDKHDMVDVKLEDARGVRFADTGEEFRLGRPVKYKGADLIFSFFDGELYSRDAFATFPPNSYSEESPYEHFAEAGADYLLDPESLIRYSIKDFEFFEKRLRVYDSPENPTLKFYRSRVDQDLIAKKLSEES